MKKSNSNEAKVSTFTNLLWFLFSFQNYSVSFLSICRSEFFRFCFTEKFAHFSKIDFILFQLWEISLKSKANTWRNIISLSFEMLETNYFRNNCFFWWINLIVLIIYLLLFFIRSSPNLIAVVLHANVIHKYVLIISSILTVSFLSTVCSHSFTTLCHWSFKCQLVHCVLYHFKVFVAMSKSRIFFPKKTDKILLKNNTKILSEMNSKCGITVHLCRQFKLASPFCISRMKK